jgi:hypothetical protein
MADGDTATKHPTHTNRKVERRSQRRIQREAHETPFSIAWCLNNPQIVARRFTPYQWMVLGIAWGGWTGYRTSEFVARTMGEPSERVREAREAAERTAYELAYVWWPANRRWRRIQSGHPHIYPDGSREKLSAWDRKMLDKHRHTKKGRRAVPGNLYEVSPRAGQVGGRDIPFSALSAMGRKAEGIPAAYGEPGEKD